MADDQYEGRRCPVCMDPPHNCVLIDCSSERCRCYICHTNKLFSNCLEQFANSRVPTCPLCRGQLLGCSIDQRAREYFDEQKRDCPFNNCSFEGSFKELRTHVQREHTYDFLLNAQMEQARRTPHVELEPPNIGDFKFPPPPHENCISRLLYPVYKFCCHLLNNKRGYGN